MARRPAGLMSAPIGEARLSRHLRRAQEHAHHAALLSQLALETGGDVVEEQAKAKHRRAAADERTLRGLPAIGRGVSGAIRGTQPGANLFR